MKNHWSFPIKKMSMIIYYVMFSYIFLYEEIKDNIREFITTQILFNQLN